MKNKFRAEIIPGRGIGRTLGFPTINLAVPENFESRYGSYAAHAQVEGKEFLAAGFFGPRRNWDELEPVLEVHILDFDGEITADELEVEFVEYLRPPERFADYDELAAMIGTDCDRVREILG